MAANGDAAAYGLREAGNSWDGAANRAWFHGKNCRFRPADRQPAVRQDRPYEPVAAARQCLDPALTTRLLTKHSAQRRNLNVRLLSSTARSGQAASISASFENGAPARSTCKRNRITAR